jgi:hypothetical protein
MNQDKLSFDDSKGFYVISALLAVFFLMGAGIMFMGEGIGLVGLFPMLVAIAGIAFYPRRSLTLYRQTRKALFESKALVHYKKSVEIDFSTVEAVKLAQVARPGRHGTRNIEILVFKQSGGAETAIEGLVTEEAEAKKVADFVGVQFINEIPKGMESGAGMYSGAWQKPGAQ